MAAKFYDPLYYDCRQDDADPFLCVDHHYFHKAAAYIALKMLQGRVILKYYGSYTLDLPVHNEGQQWQRHVRLILIECVCVQGISMDKLNSKSFPQSNCQALMKAVVDAESEVYSHNILHRDLDPQNVMLLSHRRFSRVLFIDVGKSTFRRGWDCQRCTSGEPILPLLQWHTGRQNHVAFCAWIDWDWQSWLERIYNDTRSTITECMTEHWKSPFPSASPPGVTWDPG